MKNVFKNLSVIFIFVLLISGVFADPDIMQVGSDAKEKGFLGIGDSISFYVLLNEPAIVSEIEPKEYNSKELTWTTEDSKEYVATYKVEEGDSSQEIPLQLGNIKGLLEDGKILEKENEEIVLKSIDATRPKFDVVSLGAINYHNKEAYPIFFKLEEIEKDSILNYTITGKTKTITKSEELRGHFEECLANPVMIASGCPISIIIDLSDFDDGKIKINLEVVDRANNSTDYSQYVIKDTILPEIQKVDAPNINASNYKNYSLKIKTTKEYKNIKLIFEDSVNTLSFEKLEGLDLSSLDDGFVRFKITVSDAYDNVSKEYMGDLKKDLIAPELELDKETILSNVSDINITGTIIDKLNEIIIVKYSIQDTEYSELKDCVVRYSPSIANGYNYITCNLDKLKDGEYKVLVKAYDSAQNVDEVTVQLKISTKEVYFDLDNGTRLVKNTSPEKINGKIMVNPIAETTMIAMLRSTKPNQLNYRKYNVLFNDGKFEIDLSNSVSGTAPVLPLEEGEYLLSVRLKDNYGNAILKTQKIIIDKTNPIIEMDSLSTTDRTPVITGKVKDKNATDVSVVINSNTYKATISGETWSVEVNDTLPLGDQEVKVIAKDEAENLTEADNSINIYSTGGGTRITPAITTQETQAPEIPNPIPTPIVEQPQPVPENTNAGNGETLTPVVETPIETTQLEETPVAETPSPSGLTGFAGFASSPGGVVTIIGGILVVIGAVGYFFFLRPR